MPKLKDRADRAIDEAIGRRIKLRRVILNLSQEAVAKELGITFQQLQKYENGSNRLVASRLYRLAFVLKTSAEYFFADLDLPQDAAFERDDSAVLDERTSRLSIKLMRAFARIHDPRIRRSLVNLVDEMAKSETDASDLDEG
ncbi:MAG: helix-turn-helix transcriptional regulator [Rhizomicrobium sp.]